MQGRIVKLAAFFLVGFGILFLQLNNLQIVQSKRLTNAPGNTRGTISSFSIPRGAILSSDGVVMAESVKSSSIYHYRRTYPDGSLFSTVTGFDSLIYGKSGLEATYNTQLTGEIRPVRSVQDLFRTRYVSDSVVTTIDSKLQQVATTALGSHIGDVVAIDPRTGGVLALVSEPTTNLSALSSPVGSTETAAWDAGIAGAYPTLEDTALTRAYPPGSTFKVVDSTAVLDHDRSILTQTFPAVSFIPLPLTTNTLSNYASETCGGGIAEMLAVSCDTGFATIGLQLGATTLNEEATAFGFNSTPPIDLPGAAKSTFPPVSFFSQNTPQLAFSAIGQGNVAATPLQMALVAAGIANGGTIMTPHLMSRIVNNENQTVTTYQPTVWKRVTSSATAATVTSWMEGVVRSGTAAGIAIPNVAIAAKTGTAQTNAATSTGSSGALDNWMIAFAPAQNPTIAVAVVVPAQPGLGANPTGAAFAGPVVKAVLEQALGVG